MKVILLQDIPGLGKKYDIKRVADGHARNFLLPKGTVKPVTDESLKWLKAQQEEIRVESEKELEKIQSIASSLDGFELIVPVKVGDKDQLFEAITVTKVAEKLKEQGFDIKKTQIALKAPIKEAGEFPIKITFGHNLEGEIKLIVVEEK
jgi:large subunit ribosomal protein L9